MFDQAAAVARFFEIALQPLQVAAGREVEVHGRSAIASDGLAQIGGQRVDQAALDAGLSQHAFALQRMFDALPVAPMRDHRFQWCAGMLVRQEFAPADVEAAVGRLQRRDVDAARGERLRPRAVRAQLWPAAAAQGQHHGVGGEHGVAIGRGETQRAIVVPAQPAVVDMELHAGLAQSAHPATQQRCGLAIHREHPA